LRITFKVLHAELMSATVEANESTPYRYSMGEAARAVGRSKAAISRAIANGTISAEKQPNGSYKIDPAELHRVYPKINGQPNEKKVADTVELNAQNRELQAKLEAAAQRLAELKDELADLRDDRNQWREQAQRLAIADQRAKAGEVIAMPPLPVAPAPVEASPAPPARVSPPPAPTDAQVAPVADNQPQQYPARAVVKKAPKRTPKADAEVSWWRKMIGGR
jgi:hypothetical protein